MLMPLSYVAYGKCVTSSDVRDSFITVRRLTYGAGHWLRGAHNRARVLVPPEPGSAHCRPMKTNEQSSLERAAYDAGSGASPSAREQSANSPEEVA